MTPGTVSGRVSSRGAEDDGTSASGRDLPARADFSLRTVRTVLAGIPSFGRLLFRLMRDGRVSALDRALFGATLLYLVWPVDLLPDWLAGLGQIDDLVLLALALSRLLYRTDEEVLLEHWEGESESLLLIEDLFARVARALPWWARRLLRAGS